jgi:hypothetical protein
MYAIMIYWQKYFISTKNIIQELKHVGGVTIINLQKELT